MDPEDVQEMYRRKPEPKDKHKQRQPAEVVRVRLRLDGSMKRMAWQYVEPLLRTGKAELVDATLYKLETRTAD